MTDCDAVIVGSGPAGATAADVLTAAGWSVIILEKGRNHLLDLEPPFAPAGEVSNDEIKFSRRHFLGPDPLLEPRTYRNRADEGDAVDVGEVNNLPSTVGGGGFHADGKLPRFREDDFAPLSTAGPVEGADLVDWPVDYDEMEPYYAAAEQAVGVAGEAGANPFAVVARGPVPDAAGPRHVLRGPHRRGRDPARVPPVPRADRCEQRRVRRPARVQQLRLLRLLRLPDRREGRPGRTAARRAAHGALRDPTRVLRDRRAARRVRSRAAACATWTTTWSSTRSARTTSSSRPARSRHRGCCCAPSSGTRTSSGASCSTTSRRSCSASSRTACTATAAAR